MLFVAPVLGGLFTQDLTWRWCFYINLPIIAIAVAGVFILFHNPEAIQSKKTFLQKLNQLDWIGPLFFIPATVFLILALQLGGANFAWNSALIISLFCGFAILLPIWIYTQYRLGEKATIPLRIMFQRTVCFSSIFSFCSGGAFTILAFYLPLYFQAIKDSNPAQSGVEILGLILTSTIASFLAGVLVQVMGYYTPVMIFGMAEFTVAAGLITMLGVDTPNSRIIGFEVLAGIGMGLNFQVLSLFLLF